MKKLSELIEEENRKKREEYRNSPDKDIGYYYEVKQERIRQGLEVETFWNEDDDLEDDDDDDEE